MIIENEITLTSQLLIPKDKNLAGMDVIISAGTKISKMDDGRLIFSIYNNGCLSNSPQSDIAFCNAVWELANKQSN